MKSGCEETVVGQLNTVDRFSDLPDFILHRIISFVGMREAYRTCILSKRWAHISATNPIIEVHYYCKAKNSFSRYWPSKEVTVRLLEHIDTRMQRYFKDKLRIRTLKFSFPTTHEVLGSEVEELGSKVKELEFSRKFEELSFKVDEWIRIAVCNLVTSLGLDGPFNYQLPDILLSAKSLRHLKCYRVQLPYYNVAINLASLQTLQLISVDVEERMLNHIISSCLLLHCLSILNCSGFKNIVIPWCSQVKELTLRGSLPENGRIILETSCLMYFKLSDYDASWPVMSKLGLLRNLRTLDVVFTGITDEDFGKLLPELASLENLRLTDCDLTMIRISSIQLKKIYLNDCYRLLEVTIDAPSLTKFEFKGDFYPHCVITISSQASCNISLSTTSDWIDNEGFFKLKWLMTGLRSCNALEISLDNYADESVVCDGIEFNEEELEDVNFGLPHDIKELKLTLDHLKLSRSSVSALLNGLFWTCRPDIISLQFQLKDPGLMIQLFMSELEDMANCWRHPLKRVEFPSSNCSNFLKSEKVYVELRW